MRKRTAALLTVGLLACGLCAQSARADEVAVPISLQVDLLVKVVAYDRNFAARAGEQARTLVVVKPGSDESAQAGAQASAALADKSVIAGLPHAEEVLPYGGAQALAEAVRARRAAIVYLMPGFSAQEIDEIGRALDGIDVLSASAVPSHLGHGVVLGFDLVSGKAKLLIALGQASKQKVSLSANVLQLMTVLP